jgi:hypothetical protein
MRKFDGRCVRMFADGVSPPTFEEYVESHKGLYSNEEIEAARMIQAKREKPKKKKKRVVPHVAPQTCTN